jgi:SulP family sulfate permease
MRKSLISELREDVTSQRLLPALNIGFVTGIVFVMNEVSYAAMIFSGDLSSLATRGAGLILFGGFIMSLFAALTSSLKATAAHPQDATAAVLSTVAVAISASVEAPMEVKFMTVAVVLALSSLLTGAAFIMVGRFRLANLLRFIPYPVIGGFLAGTGWVIVAGGIAVMSGMPVSLNTLSRLTAPDIMLRWLPGVAFAAVLFTILLRKSHFLILPGSIIGALVLFHLGLSIGGVSSEEAKASGFLVSGVPDGGLWPAFTLKDLAMIDWASVWSQIPGILTVALIATLGMLLNMSGIELAAGEELDTNREFAAGGIANCLAALGGCYPGYPTMSLTLLSLKTGVSSRLTGITAALIIGGVLFIGGKLLEYFPKALIGGMLLMLGFSLIHGWIVTARKRMPWPDYCIMVSIFFVIGLFGYMEGVAFGLLATVLFFVVRFSRVPVVKNKFSALDRRSIKARPVPHRKILCFEGWRIKGYELTGYLFFGSAATLLQSLKKTLTSESRPDFILLDFALVSGLDISAFNNFHRFALHAEAARTAVVITGAPDRLAEALKRNLPATAMRNISFFPDLDHGLEFCEEQIIERTVSNSQDEILFNQSVDHLLDQLEKQERFEHLVDCLAPWTELREQPKGSTILRKGEPAGGLHLLTRGSATEIDPDTGARIRSLTPGSVIGAAAAFGSYTAPATVMADSDCRTVILSPESRSLLEREEPGLAINLHGFLIQTIGR